MTENWNTSGLIIEGICGTGKTTLFHALLQCIRFVQKSFLSTIALSEHQTQRVLEHKEREQGLAPADNIALLDQHVTYWESIHTRLEQMPWRQDNRTNMRMLYILERFHFTHVYHYRHMNWRDVQGIDARLAQLNCKLCLLTMSDTMMEQRIITSRDAGWRDYLKQYGETNDEIIEHYIAQQELLRRLCEQSQLDTLIIDTSESSIDTILPQVLDFWGAI
ncbi:hypothetical protein ACFL34_06015 [Candidatus Sumerlaeota bacterium]